MSRRRQLQPIVGPLLDIYGCDLGAPIVAHLLTVADLLDDYDDLIGDRLTVDADDRWHLPDVG